MRCSRYVKWDNILKSRLLLQPPNVQKSLTSSDFSIFSCIYAEKVVPLQRFLSNEDNSTTWNTFADGSFLFNNAYGHNRRRRKGQRLEDYLLLDRDEKVISYIYICRKCIVRYASRFMCSL